MCVWGIDLASVSTIFQLDFEIVPTVWYFLWIPFAWPVYQIGQATGAFMLINLPSSFTISQPILQLWISIYKIDVGIAQYILKKIILLYSLKFIE
jgi:hypothetical protein